MTICQHTLFLPRGQTTTRYKEHSSNYLRAMSSVHTSHDIIKAKKLTL